MEVGVSNMNYYNSFNEMFNANNTKQNMSVFNTLCAHEEPRKVECYWNDYYGEWCDIDEYEEDDPDTSLNRCGTATCVSMAFLDLPSGRFQMKEFCIFPDGVIGVDDMTNSTAIMRDTMESFGEWCYDDCYNEFYGDLNGTDYEDYEYLRDSISDDMEEYEARNKQYLEKKFSDLLYDHGFGWDYKPGNGGFNNLTIDTEDDGEYRFLGSY